MEIEIGKGKEAQSPGLAAGPVVGGVGGGNSQGRTAGAPMGYKGHRIVDLTQELYDGQPVFIGHPETKVWPCMSHEESARMPVFKDGMSYTANVLQLCEHGPTHVD